MSKPIIGITGSMQTGKQENLHRFTHAGWEVLDLNLIAQQWRLSRPRVLCDLGLADKIEADGRKSRAWYQAVLAQPSLHIHAQAAENQHLIEMALPQIVPGMVVSWGYLYQLEELLAKLDFLLLFQSDHAEWLARLRRKSGIEDDRIIQSLAQAIEMDQATIKGKMMIRFPDTMMTVDTSGDDWGAYNVETAVSLLD